VPEAERRHEVPQAERRHEVPTVIRDAVSPARCW
jgi:hypothetical protein